MHAHIFIKKYSTTLSPNLFQQPLYNFSFFFFLLNLAIIGYFYRFPSIFRYLRDQSGPPVNTVSDTTALWPGKLETPDGSGKETVTRERETRTWARVTCINCSKTKSNEIIREKKDKETYLIMHNFILSLQVRARNHSVAGEEGVDYRQRHRLRYPKSQIPKIWPVALWMCLCPVLSIGDVIVSWMLLLPARL